MASTQGEHAATMDYARLLFEDGQGIPAECAPDVVVRSWHRSRHSGRSFRDKVIFNPVPGNARQILEEQHHALLAHVTPALHRLIALLDRDEWAASLIDTEGQVVRTLRPDHPRFRGLISAFRPGVNLGEPGAGTTGPSCALAEKRTVVVAGKEHFLDEAAEFACSSAPLFDPLGRVVGVINASRQFLGGKAGVPAAVSAIARLIEARMVEALPGAFCINVSLPLEDQKSPPGILAFSPDGVLLGSNRHARELLGINPAQQSLFSELFGTSFATAVDRLRSNSLSPLGLWANTGQRLDVRHLPLARSSTGRPRSLAGARINCDLFPAECQEQITFLHKAFNRDVPVLINGQTGTGKEALARWLHAHGPRAAGPCVTLNCSAIPANLIESELFGYAAGAFTGASRGGMVGKLQQAHGGTLFLDEIGDMPLELQSRLLRVLQERKVSPIGSRKEYPVDFSLLSATHRDLQTMVTNGQFREDLFYRINGFRIHLPDLNTRSDFDQVVARLLAECTQPDGSIPTISPAALDTLRRCRWPGNIRQLASAIRLATVLASDGRIQRFHLPAEILESSTADEPVAFGALAEAEAKVIRAALAAHRGCVSTTARALALSRATLYKKLKAYQINWRKT